MVPERVSADSGGGVASTMTSILIFVLTLAALLLWPLFLLWILGNL